MHTAVEAILSFFLGRLYLRFYTDRTRYPSGRCYMMLVYDTNGYKDVLGLWINKTESKNAWMQIFDELKARGIEDLGILSIDGVSGLEEGTKAIFPNVTVQRCIVHLVRNSIRYIPRKQWNAFTKQLKGIYGAVNVEEAQRAFDQFKQDWQGYPGAGAV